MIIPGFSRYDITEDGVVTDLKRQVEMKPRITNTRGCLYKNVNLVDDAGNRKVVSVLRLLAIAYLPAPANVCVARAKDCDNTNTVLENVEWLPCSERVQMEWKNGKMAKRKKRDKCYDKHSIALVYDTLLALEEPMSMAALSRMLDVPYSVVRYSVDVLVKRGRLHKTAYGVEVLK